MEKLSSTKQIPGAKRGGDHCSRRSRVSTWLLTLPPPPTPHRCFCLTFNWSLFSLSVHLYLCLFSDPGRGWESLCSKGKKVRLMSCFCELTSQAITTINRLSTSPLLSLVVIRGEVKMDSFSFPKYLWKVSPTGWLLWINGHLWCYKTHPPIKLLEGYF